MHDLKTELKLKWWPSLQDYNEAIQIPQASLQDLELKKGLPYATALGLPRPITGAFASVYRMHCADGDYALRLFLRNIQDQAERYALISHFVQHDSLPYTVTFDFLIQGIRTRGDWFPALKMEWVEGTPFEEYVVENLKDPVVLGELNKSFVQMMSEMRFAGIAHGDLQHGNIIMCGNELRLVDYDGMFVPAMKNFMASEIGHPNYQHPKRAAHHFGPYLDNFSAWIIYASVRALQLDPSLLNQLGGGDDCLLFRRSDFLNPLQSPAFAAFEKHENNELRALGGFVRAQLDKDPETIPYLQLPIPEIRAQLEPIPDTVSKIKSGPRLVRGEASDWLQEDNIDALHKPGISKSKLVQAATASPSSWIVQAQAAQNSVWVKPTSNSSQSLNATNSSLGLSQHGASLFPPEITNNQVPRPVTFGRPNGLRQRPEVYQWLMLLFPIVWFMVVFFSLACTIDENLRINGQTYDATIANVVRYKTHNKNGTTPHTDVTANYKVNGKIFEISRDMGADYGKFKKGDVYPIRALPSDPTCQEPFGGSAGSRQRGDLAWAWSCLFINLCMELWIWVTPIHHKRLASNGTPVLAKVVDLEVNAGGKTTYYVAVISYTVYSKFYKKRININRDEYYQLKVGGTEIILSDPNYMDDLIFYKFCLYKPFLPSGFMSSHQPRSSSSKAQTRP